MDSTIESIKDLRSLRLSRWFGAKATPKQCLAAGALDLLIGDGRLKYGPEYLWESYYSARLFPGFYTTFDLQHYTNPAYNQDRGPVTVYSFRLHIELGLRPWQRQ